MFEDDLDDKLEKAEELLSQPPTLISVVDLLDALITKQSEALYDQETEEEITNLLEQIDDIATKHADLAARNHHRSIYSDLLILRNHARHCAKKVFGKKYWRTK
jgi:hypothetical protein